MTTHTQLVSVVGYGVGYLSGRELRGPLYTAVIHGPIAVSPATPEQEAEYHRQVALHTATLAEYYNRKCFTGD